MSADDKVGYRRPPKHSQFKPGRSGNPRGRPRRSDTLKDIIENELFKIVSVKENGRPIKTQMAALLVKAQLHKAVGGDTKAFALIMQLVDKVSKLTEPAVQQDNVPLPANDRAILDAYFAHQGEGGGDE